MTETAKLNIFRFINSNTNEKTNLIFDYEQAIRIREHPYRINGRLIGSKTVTNQQANTSSFVPLQISDEELLILLENFKDKFEVLRTRYDMIDFDIECFKQKFSDYMVEISRKQSEDFVKMRRRQMLDKKDKILEGKRKKITQEMNKLDNQDQVYRDLQEQLGNLEKDFEKDLENIANTSQVSEEDLIEIFVKTPEFYSELFKAEIVPHEELELLRTTLDTICKYQVMKLFWQKGFYLTSGAKFGGDFLAYPDTPEKYHSQFILVCLENNTKKLTLKELITYARMATSVKKTVIIATYKSNTLQLTSINWSHQ